MADSETQPTAWDHVLRLRRAGRTAEALAALDQQCAHAPSEETRRLRTGLLVELARSAREAGDASAALAHLESAGADGEFPDLAYERGLAHLALEDHAAARTAFAHAVGRAPRFAAAGLELALLDAREGRIADALARLKRLIETASPEDRSGLAEGTARLRAGAWEEAEAKMRASYEESAAMLRGGFQRFGRLLEEGDPMRALDAARQLVRRYPSYADAQHALGLAYLALGWPDDAIAAFARALERNPDYYETRVYLAWTLFAQGETSEAEYELDRVLHARPGYEPALRLRASRSGRMGVRNDAHEHRAWPASWSSASS